MSKFRIHRVTDADKWLSEEHSLGTDPRNGATFVLVDKEGNLFQDDCGNVPVYLTDIEVTKKHPELLFTQNADAYAYFSNYADTKGIPFKKYSAMELLTVDHSLPVVLEQEDVSLDLFSYAIGDYKESESPLSKPIKKIAASFGRIAEEMGAVEKQVGKLRLRMADLDVERENWLLDRENANMENGYENDGQDDLSAKEQQEDNSWDFEEKDTDDYDDYE